MNYEQVQQLILSEVDNQVTIFDALDLAEMLEINERTVREGIYKLQEKGHPIINKDKKVYQYILDKNDPTMIDLIQKEVRARRKAFLSSRKRELGLMKNLPLKYQMALDKELISELNVRYEELSVHPQQNEIDELIDSWDKDLLDEDPSMPVLKTIAEETV